MSEPIHAETVTPAAPARQGFLGRLRTRVAALSRSRHAHVAMLGVSVIDGSVFPVPPFALLVPMVLAEPKKWLRYAVTGTLASLVGGLIGYGLGHLGGEAIASTLGITTDIAIQSKRLGVDTTLGQALTDNFWMLALLCSILPTPYKVVAIGSGLVGVGLPEFLLASVIGRSARFFGVSGAFAFFGEKARRYIKV
jgi:membrane protein YqaA with SNARE-associated domain